MSEFPNSVKDEVQALREALKHHNQLYYMHDAPEIPDAEYDRLFQRLLALEAEYPALSDPDSPTQRVGSSPLSVFEPYKHQVPMLSLSNVFDAVSLQAFDQRVRERLDDHNALDYVCEPKFDGVALSLVYKAVIAPPSRVDPTQNKGQLIQSQTTAWCNLITTRDLIGLQTC